MAPSPHPPMSFSPQANGRNTGPLVAPSPPAQKGRTAICAAVATPNITRACDVSKPFVYSSEIMITQQKEDELIRPGYEHCPLCGVLVRSADLVHHIRHSGCRLCKPRQRELTDAGQGKTPCPICKRLIVRTELREHLQTEHPEHPHERGKCYRYTAG